MSRYTSDGFTGSQLGEFSETQLRERNANGYTVPDVQYVYALCYAPLPYFKPLFNTETAYSSAYYAASLRRFRTRDYSNAVTINGSASTSSWQDTQDSTTYFPASTNASGKFAETPLPQGQYTSIDQYMFLYGSGTSSIAATSASYDVDFTDQFNNHIVQHYSESLSNEADVGNCKIGRAHV